MLPPPHLPRLHIDTHGARAGASSSYTTPLSTRDVQDRFSHFHTSVFRFVSPAFSCAVASQLLTFHARSRQLEIQLHSCTVRSSHKHTYEPAKTLPVYGDHDRVEGAVLLDSQLSASPGRLVITVSCSSHQCLKVVLIAYCIVRRCLCLSDPRRVGSRRHRRRRGSPRPVQAPLFFFLGLIQHWREQ